MSRLAVVVAFGLFLIVTPLKVVVESTSQTLIRRESKVHRQYRAAPLQN